MFVFCLCERSPTFPNGKFFIFFYLSKKKQRSCFGFIAVIWAIDLERYRISLYYSVWTLCANMANWKYRRNDLHATIVLNVPPFHSFQWNELDGRTVGRSVRWERRFLHVWNEHKYIFKRNIFILFWFGFGCGGCCCCCDSKSYWNQTPHTISQQTREKRERQRQNERASTTKIVRCCYAFSLGLVVYALWVFFVVVHRLYTVSTCWTGSANYTYYCQYLFKQGASKKTRSKRNHLRGFLHHLIIKEDVQPSNPIDRPADWTTKNQISIHK